MIFLSFTESYFPELENRVPVNTNKWGIMNVCLSNCDKVVTGHQWKYTYFDGEKTRIISSYDLTKLRQKVLRKGLDWIITDNKYAIDAYKLNNELKKKHDSIKRTHNRKNYGSGVKYVYKTRDKRSKNGYYWVYLNRSDEGQKTYTNKTLTELRKRVTDNGLKWEVVNPEVYEEIVNNELNPQIEEAEVRGGDEA